MTARRNIDQAEVVRLYAKLKNMTAVRDALGLKSTNTVRYHLRAAGVEVKEKPKQRRSDGQRIHQVRGALRVWGPLTTDELAQALEDAGTPITRQTLRNHITRWRKLHGHTLIRVAGWQVQEGKPRPVFGLGPLPDAVYVKMTQAECCRRYRQKYAAMLRARDRQTPASPWTGLGAC